MTARKPQDDGFEELPRMPLRRRVLIVLLAIVTSIMVVLLLLERPGDPKRGLPRAAPPHQQPCKPGQTADCVGGKADVIVLPPVLASSQAH